LEYAGMMNFTENAPWKRELDSGASQWEAFVKAMHQKFDGRNVKAQEIVEWLDGDKDLMANFPDEIDQAMTKASKAKALSKCLGKKINVRYQNGFMLTKETEKHTGVAMFSVVEYTDQGLF
jgi:hypothetical protein